MGFMFDKEIAIDILQKIKAMLQEYGTDVNETSQKIALLGSLSLYLDFINMFLYLLRLFGRRS